MFKIAYCAGHYIGTAGKRLPKALDPNETREWILNNRVADFFAMAALEYEGVELLRTDDPTGKKHISIQDRTAKANDWDADIYVDMHHNAAGKIFSGGGVEAFCTPEDEMAKIYRNAIYEAVIAAGGLRGNRANPLQEKQFDTMKYAEMSAIIMEYGFMDSYVDAPVILQESYSRMVAYATMEGIAKVAGLKKAAASTNNTALLAVDGKWGSATTKRLQEIFGTTNDGVISNQWAVYKNENPGLASGWEWEENPSGKGSQLIKAMQRWAGMPEPEQDGEAGPKTFSAIQKKMRTTADGYVSDPSQMVKALQRWANEQ